MYCTHPFSTHFQGQCEKQVLRVYKKRAGFGSDTINFEIFNIRMFSKLKMA